VNVLAVCLAAAALLAATPGITLGILGYRRLSQELLDLEDRIDQAETRAVMPLQAQRPTPPTSLFDRRPEET
jgi:hypothetical protein